MGHKNKVDLHQQIKQELKSMERFGESKYEAKRSGTYREGIYSYSTAKTYNRACQKFAEYVREVSPQGRYTSLEEAKQYAKAYIEKENANHNKSAYTVKMERSALAKLYRVEARELGFVDERSRANITRDRAKTVISEKTGKVIKNTKTCYGRFSEKNNKEIVEFCRSTGLRRSELIELKGNQLVEKNGNYYLDVKGKGGRERLLPIRGNVDAVVTRCVTAKDNRVWEKVPGHMSVHNYRSEYATALYKELARPIELIPKSERYFCRGDLKGTWYDKVAMKEVSEALGHSRISVIAEHYLR